MSARVKTKLFTFTLTSHNLGAVLNSPQDAYVGSLALRAHKENVGDITWDDGTGDPGGYLEPREAVSFDLTGKFIATTSFNLAGTVGDKIYITVIA